MRLSLYFLFSLLITFLNVSPTNGEIMKLDDGTFEHETQSSTGMTTGSWLIFFKAARCPHCQKLLPHLERLSEDQDLYEQGIVLGSVDVLGNRGVSVRFGIRGFPTLVYLHQGRMYIYKGKSRTFDAVKKFVMGGYREEEGEVIPKPTTAMEHGMKIVKAIGLELFDAARGKQGPAGYAMIVMVGILMFLFFGFISLCFLPSTKQKDSWLKFHIL